jgi:hypothetical protein
MSEADAEEEQRERHLHKLMLTGDVTAPARIAELFLPILSRKISARSTNVHPHMIDTAVADALLNYLKNPKMFDPNKLPLGKFLLMAASRDLKNLLSSRAKEVERWGYKETVELEGSASEQVSEESDETRARILNVVNNEIDRKLVSLMADGVRETHAYAEVLGITHLPGKQQAKTVKRHKDRLMKALRSARKRIGRKDERGEH